MRRLSRALGGRRFPRVQPLSVVLAVLAVAIAASLVVRVLRRPEPGGALQIQVLNGSGVSEIAQKAARELRLRGLDVVAMGNADSQGYRETLVLVRRGHAAVGRQVRDALGRGRVLVQRDPTLLVDVTVILGQDYAPPDGR